MGHYLTEYDAQHFFLLSPAPLTKLALLVAATLNRDHLLCGHKFLLLLNAFTLSPKATSLI